MDLQKILDESGYTQAAAECEELKRQRAELVRVAPNAPPDKQAFVRGTIAEMDEAIVQMEKALSEELAATIKNVDANNDLDFAMLDMMERAELVLEYVEQDLPDHPNTAEIRKLVEAIRANEKYEPEKD